jgi:hypothetical protein
LPVFDNCGDQFSIYIEKSSADSFVLSDDAYLLHDAQDLCVFSKKHEEILAQICLKYGIELQENECLCSCSTLQLEDALQRFLRTLIEIHNNFF